MTTYTLTTPLTVGTLGSQSTVSSLQITVLEYSSTPALAPLGTAELSVTLTDPNSGWQERVLYQDASVFALWQSAQSPAPGTQLGDILAAAVFAKLIADGKLPAGTISNTAN